ncbi:MAG: site-2 protease family protein [Alphaproteobacteria bacterium]
MDPILIAIQLISLLIGFSLHEAGHAYCASFLGDNTSQKLGRLTANPLKHLDPFGSVVLPIMLILAGSPFIFAAAKPVPVNPRNFKRPFADFAIVALAGPMVNIFLALAAALTMRYTGLDNAMLITFLVFFIWINLVLAFFNLLPIPPLDGSKVLAGLLPRAAASQFIRLEKFGFLFLILLIFGGSLLPFSPLAEWIFFLKAAFNPLLEHAAGFPLGEQMDQLFGI